MLLQTKNSFISFMCVACVACCWNLFPQYVPNEVEQQMLLIALISKFLIH